VALSDWTVYKTSGEAALIDTSAPLVGSGSLKITTNTTGVVELVRADSGERAFTKGRIRTLMKATGPLTNPWAGIYCMASQADLTATGSCYCLVLGSAAGNVVRIIKQTAGLDNGSGSVASAAFAVDVGTLYCLELEWDYDPVTWSGTRLSGRAGVQSDFSDLTELVTYTDTSSPLTTSVGEGIFVASFSASETYFFDKTTITQLG
jgi:hypothetical protein